MEAKHQTIFQKVLEIIFLYRATPLANGLTPAEKFYQKEFRIKLDTYESQKI